MPRIVDQKKSKLIKGIEKVIDRQANKPKVVDVDFGMNTFRRFRNADRLNLEDFYYPLLWQPLKYVIHRVPHTTYTYEVSKLALAQNALKRAKRKLEQMKKRQRKN